MSNKFYLLVAGSRTFTDVDLMDRKLARILDRVGVECDNIVLVHGGARGADTIASNLAEKFGWEIVEFKADWDHYGKSAGYRRNRQMHEFLAQHKNRGCVCFWDGESRGTAHNFELAKEFNTPLRVVRFKNHQQEFNEIMDAMPKCDVNEDSKAWSQWNARYQACTGRSYWD